MTVSPTGVAVVDAGWATNGDGWVGVTGNVYAVPGLSPVAEYDVAPAGRSTAVPPGSIVRWYPIGAAPVGAIQVRSIVPAALGVPVRPVTGARTSGAGVPVTAFEAGLSPT